MAMTQTGLVILTALATLATIGMRLRTGLVDRMLMSVLAAVLWGVMGLSAFDVIVVDTYAATRSEPMEPLAFTGLGLAGFTAIFALRNMALFIQSGASAATEGGMMDG